MDWYKLKKGFVPVPRVLFVLKYRQQPYGSDTTWGDGTGPFLSSGLYNSANMVKNMLIARGVAAKLVHVTDNNAIHKEIVEFAKEGHRGWDPPTHVIIEAFWVVPEKFEVLKKACPYVRHWIVRNHSHTPFLASEGMGFDWSIEYAKRGVQIACNDLRMLEETRYLVARANPWMGRYQVEKAVPFLPNYYPTPAYNPKNKVHLRQSHIDVGCFGAIRPLKNHIMQAIAAIKVADRLGKKLRFFINSGRVEMNGAPILNNLRGIFKHLPHHELVEVPWMDHTSFRELTKKMHLVTQVTFSETFNIVAADAVTQGVPTVVSSDVPWSSKLYQAEPRSSGDISNVMQLALRTNQLFPSYNPNLDGLRRYDAQSAKIWMAQLAR